MTIEEENKALKNKIEEYQKALELEKQKNKLHCISRNSTVSEILNGKYDLYKLLEFRLNKPDGPTISNIIKQISTIYSLQSTTKTKGFETYINSFLEILIPPPYKYVLWSAKTGKGLLNRQDNEVILNDDIGEMSELHLNCQVNDVMKVQIEKYETERKKIGALLNEFINIKDKLLKESSFLENEILNNFIPSTDPGQ